MFSEMLSDALWRGAALITASSGGGPPLAAEGRGNPRSTPSGRAPQGFWNFTWTAQDELSFPEEMTSPEFRCHGNRQLCSRPSNVIPEFSWSLMTAEDPWEKGREGVQRGARLQNWEEGKQATFRQFSKSHEFL
ncbi:hypothetical protein AAFF_G00387770 [Aldrovandia affinis]|uniref:Uncharacterized protein n=1 Tax=Aldrovandia affinis TaxID=143900 RepID=A0AAD7SEN2_9TELE|nr:hypothetical protein AAFF_G00387770 [Aldrovandia affinis]